MARLEGITRRGIFANPTLVVSGLFDLHLIFILLFSASGIARDTYSYVHAMEAVGAPRDG